MESHLKFENRIAIQHADFAVKKDTKEEQMKRELKDVKGIRRG